MFPISDSIPSRKFPLVNIFLILITSYVFFKELSAPSPDGFINQFALIPSLVNFNNFNTLIPFVSAIFLHGGWLHILSNMWFLWIFGDNVEDYFGHLTYLFLYFIFGIAGNLLQYFLMPTSTIPMLGASGAIAGVLGAYFVLYPYSRVKTLVPIFFFFTFIDIPAFIMLGYWFVLQIFSGAGSLSVASSGGIAFFAHIGGFVTGAVIASLFKKKTTY
ncbi:MAG TPA: rhomboid family intramembrane serine protease [Patescibacteria group bacterium]